MSTRLLKKLQVCSDDNRAEKPTDVEGFEETNNDEKSVLNRYDLLTLQSQSESEIKEDVRSEEINGGDEDSFVSIKKKKRRKHKKNPKKSFRSDKVVGVKMVEKDILLKENSEDSNSDGIYFKEVLKVFMKNLNYNYEKARKFGAKTMINEKKLTRNARYPKSHKQTALVNRQPHWPPIQKPEMSMKLLESNQNTYIFKFDHNDLYREKQRDFYRGVETLDAINIESIIHRNPYHIDALIQLSEYCKLNEDLQIAAELIERGIYFMEYVTHPLFSLTSSNCRLPYKFQENRSFFILLFKHILNVGGRSLYRTALELSKLLLSLDISDPLAVMLFIDFYALKCGEYKWILKFFKAFENEKHLIQLPNFAFSIAIANFYLNDEPKADFLLQDALIRYPQLLLRLLTKCNVQPDDSVYQVIYFKDFTKCPKSLSQLIDLYVYRSHSIWRENRNNLINWLERNVKVLVEKMSSITSSDQEYKDFYAQIDAVYHGIPKNLIRHLVLTDIKGITPLYFENLGGPIMFFDPLPPIDAVDIYHISRESTESQIATTSSLTVLLQTLSPNFNLRNLANSSSNDTSLGRNRVLSDIRRVLESVRLFVSNIGEDVRGMARRVSSSDEATSSDEESNEGDESYEFDDQNDEEDDSTDNNDDDDNDNNNGDNEAESVTVLHSEGNTNDQGESSCSYTHGN